MIPPPVVILTGDPYKEKSWAPNSWYKVALQSPLQNKMHQKASSPSYVHQLSYRNPHLVDISNYFSWGQDEPNNISLEGACK